MAAQAASDEALARDLARRFEREEEDAALARRLAAAETLAGGGGAGAGAGGFRQAGSAQCPQGHALQECVPLNQTHTCDRCGVGPIRAPGRLFRCGRCDFDLCLSCAGAGARSGPVGVLGPGAGGAAGAGAPAPAARRPGPPLSSPLVRGDSFVLPPAWAREQVDEGMLYVPCEIGGVTVEMMVDTGAQTSVISAPFAQSLGLMRHMDTSQQGIAAGVGQARILGKLRSVPVKLGHVEFALDFSVLEIRDTLFMLGLDQMRRFKCIVDLEHKNLVFGGMGGIEVPFLQDPRRQRPPMFGRQGCPAM